jgi:hypothetical protein
MYYLNPDNAIHRLREEWIAHNGLIVAVDFDSTLCPYKDYEKEYDKHFGVHTIKNLVRELKEAGCTIIIWTARAEHKHQEAKDWLAANDIKWDYFNEDSEAALKYGPVGRKIYANAYLDDRAGLWQVYHQLQGLLKEYKDCLLNNQTKSYGAKQSKTQETTETLTG